MSDQIVRGLALGNNVRVFVGKTTQLVAQAQAIHQTHPAATAALGRVMSIASVMASGFKDERETLKIDIRGNGPLKSILVNANNKGEIRGLVGNPEAHAVNDLGKLDVGGILGQGTLMVSNEFNGNTVFQSQVALQTGEIGDDFAAYFYVSEQTPSIVSVGVLVDPSSDILSAGGLLIQMMPDATDEDYTLSENLAATLRPMSELLNDGFTLEQILANLYSDVRILEERNLEFKCDCSRDRMKGALTTLSKDDLKAMIEEDHGCEINCQFCGESYKFDEEELKLILSFRGV